MFPSTSYTGMSFQKKKLTQHPRTLSFLILCATSCLKVEMFQKYKILTFYSHTFRYPRRKIGNTKLKSNISTL